MSAYTDWKAVADNMADLVVSLTGYSRSVLFTALGQVTALKLWGDDLTDTETDEIDEIISDAFSQLMIEVETLPEPGVIQLYAGDTVPTGFLFCDGASLSRTTYAALFAVIGTKYGNVDSTHFNLPDLRGRAPIGVGTGTGLSARALAAKGGEENHTLTIPELPTHSHRINVHNNGSTGTEATVPASGNAVVNQQPVTENTGSNTPHNTMQPYIVLNFIISTGL